MYIVLGIIISGTVGFFFGRLSGIHSRVLDIMERLMKEEIELDK